MTDHDPFSTERNSNLWAPWRMDYIRSLPDGIEKDGGCFLCRYRDEPGNDDENLVIWRGPRCFAVMNRFPYTGGHSLISPLEHVSSLASLDGATMQEMMEMTRDLQAALDRALGAEGYNVGINIGRCAGAGLPGHLHLHIVPRWGGDTNFMPVFGKVRVIPEALDKILQRLRLAACELDLPKLSP
ncbi:MAG: HIT family protein [Phycisphaerae bacterium]